MIVRMLTREEAKEIFEMYKKNDEISGEIFYKLDNDYKKLRDGLLEIESKLRNNAAYDFDLPFALDLYEFLNEQDFFNDTIAGNTNFWRFLCVNVVPDLVYRRHGMIGSYFYEKTGRIYLQAMWWYIHMSYQGDREQTFAILRKLNTDYIMQLVERQGRDGFYLEVSRNIIAVLALLPIEVINKKVNNSNLFRRVLIQNTAKQENFNLTVEGKSKEYVHFLFGSCKVEVSDYE